MTPMARPGRNEKIKLVDRCCNVNSHVSLDSETVTALGANESLVATVVVDQGVARSEASRECGQAQKRGGGKS
jgi:hypothetical protein